MNGAASVSAVLKNHRPKLEFMLEAPRAQKTLGVVQPRGFKRRARQSHARALRAWSEAGGEPRSVISVGYCELRWAVHSDDNTPLCSFGGDHLVVVSQAGKKMEQNIEGHP